MANAVEVDIAEAIKDELNSHDFGIAFQAERNEADPTVPLEEINQLRIDVVPWLPLSVLATRGTLRYSAPTDILIRKRFEGSQQSISSGRIPKEETDRLRKLRQDIAEFFMPSQTTNTGRSLTAIPNANWVETKVMAGLVRQHLKLHSQFTGWLRITYAVQKAAETPSA